MMKHFLYCTFALLLLVPCSCATVNSVSYGEFPASELPEGSAQEGSSEYVLQLADVIEIKFFYHPELDEIVTVRPDGRISLQLIDDVSVAGLTPLELDKILSEKYSGTVIKPEITVMVRQFAGQKVYVGGEVNAPGLIPTSGTLTALQAILRAGGFKETAHPGSVIIIRKGPKDVPLARKLNLKDVISGKGPAKDIVLKSFDIVYVPKTSIAKANKFVEQHITKMIPGRLGANFSYIIYDGDVETETQVVP